MAQDGGQYGDKVRRILLVAYNNPLRSGGDEKQARGLFTALVTTGVEAACLTLAAPMDRAQRRSHLEGLGIFSLGCFVLSHQERSHSPLAKGLFWWSAKPDQFLARQTPELLEAFQSQLRVLCQELKIDAIHCLGLRTAYFLPHDPSPAPLILDLVDCLTQHKRRELAYWLKGDRPTHSSTRHVVLALLDYWKTARIERSVLTRFQQIAPIATVSESDAQAFRQLCPQASIYPVCHPVTLAPASLEELAVVRSEFKHMVFYGVMSLLWNLDALFFLIQEILPLVRAKHPDLRLSVTGFEMPPHVVSLAETYPWIEVVPTVADIRSFILSATITCWPFRCGSGVKNKVLESMILGKPIVTTSLTVEPFTQEQQAGLLIADRAEDLAQHITQLLDNPEQRSHLGLLNHQIAQSHFTWEKKAKDYLRLYEQADRQWRLS